MTEAMAPGPAISGIANGKIATSGLRCAASSSSCGVVARMPLALTNTMSRASKNRRMPLATRNAVQSEFPDNATADGRST